MRLIITAFAKATMYGLLYLVLLYGMFAAVAYASAATVPERIEIHEGVYQHINADGSSRFGPAIGFDVATSGKAVQVAAATATFTQGWFSVFDAPEGAEVSDECGGEFGSYNPSTREWCYRYALTPETPADDPGTNVVPLPAASWLLLASLGALLGLRRYVTR